MAWIDEAGKYVSSPSVWVELDFTIAGTKKYSSDYIRPTSEAAFKGNLLSLSRIYQSIGDIKRSFELSNITIVFSDIDKEFRTLIETETIKDIAVRIKASFTNANMTTNTLTLFTGWLYGWKFLDNMQFQIECEQKIKSIDNLYPDKRVLLTDYPNADPSAIDWVIPVPYGTISDLGLGGRGAFGYPSLDFEGKGGMLFVDTTLNTEKHLVGLQTAAITVDRVYLDDILKTVVTHYNITTQVIDGKTHTLISWVAGVNPTAQNRVSCDITFGTMRPVEGIRDFLINFCGYVAGDFNAASYAAAVTLETSRGYTLDGALWESQKNLRSILDDWRDEFELDYFHNKAGEVCFKYISAVFTTPNKYTDVLSILKSGYQNDPKVYDLMNQLEYGYNFNYTRAYYHNKTTYGSPPGEAYKKFFGFRWVRSSSVAHDLAARKVLRFKGPIVFDTFQFPLKSFDEDLGDFLSITHFLGKGSSGYIDKYFQIRSMELDLDNFISTMILEDSSAFAGQACLLGDPTILPATWMLASSGERDYCYLCDPVTEQFSDGLPGKRLFD